MSAALDWTSDGGDWPNRAASRFVAAGGYVWHVQRAGRGPRLLLIHGTGAATHSWAGLFPMLAQHHEVLAMDLPGHGFTRCQGRPDVSLDGMSRAIFSLLWKEHFIPDCITGHSAGGAIAVRLSELLKPPPVCILGINAALLPLSGAAGLLGPVMAKMLAFNPLVIEALARAGRNRMRVARLIRSTGSQPSEPYLSIYARLFSARSHIRGTLRMMSSWDVGGILPAMRTSKASFGLIAAGNDRAVDPSTAEDVARRCPAAQVIALPGLGHLVHEEAPGLVSDAMQEFLRSDRAHGRRGTG
ncbi:MAG: alpha/beta fold hydrolase BchO [Hyphomonas sp.]